MTALLACLSAGLFIDGRASAQPLDLHDVHVVFKSASVSQDGDPGRASGCGEVISQFEVKDDKPQGPAPKRAFVRSNAATQPVYAGALGQVWCKGSLSPGGHLVNEVNKIVVNNDQTQPGDILHFSVTVKEYDGLQWVSATKNVNVTVPPPGHFKNFKARAQATNDTGAVDVELEFRIRTF